MLERLVGDAEDEVDRHVPDGGDGGLGTRLGLGGVVGPVHEREVVVEERLDAEREARHAEVAGGTQPRGAVGSGEVLRVGLDRHLLQCRCVEVVVGGLDHVRQGVGREERGSPPAQVQGAQRGRGTVFLAHSLRLGAQRADVAALVAAGRGEVEVAVDAALRAERDVDVEASQGERVF